MSEAYDKIILEIPIEIQIKVSNEMAFINLLTELGYREDKSWGDDEQHILDILGECAEKHTKDQLKMFESYHQHKVESISDNEISLKITQNGNLSDRHGSAVSLINWFKQRLK